MSRAIMFAMPAFGVLLLMIPLAQAKAETIMVEAGTRPDGSMFFEPGNIGLMKGERATIQVRNVDADPPVFHDLAIRDWYGPERDVEWEVRGGRTVNRSFEADRAGVFDIICQVTGHAESGMRGTFTVREEAPASQAISALLVTLGLAGFRYGRR